VAPSELTPLSLLISFVIGLLGAEFVRRYARQLNLVDLPNQRSLHAIPTPRGGGVGIVIAVIVCLLSTPPSFRYLLAGAVFVAVIGWIDDSKGLSAGIRFFFQSFAAVLAVWGFSLYFTPRFEVLNLTLEGPLLYLVSVLFIVWMLNLYNFMDGINGLAGGEAVTAGTALAVIAHFSNASLLSHIYAVIAASSAGFLLLNWSKAKVFMGDVASGFLGFLFGALAIFGEMFGQIPFAIPLILFSYFIADSGITLVRRLLRGQRVYQAHREHGYQQLVQRGFSHATISIGILAFNVFYLTPLAYLMLKSQVNYLVALLLAYVPLLIILFKIKAGTSTQRTEL
jgi:Fuc2NAc and GlcNAc transferase